MNKKAIVFLILLLVCFIDNNLCFAKGYTYLESQDEKFQEYYNKGKELKEEKKFEEAINYFKKAYEINSKHLKLLNDLCGCNKLLKNTSEMEKYAKEGLLLAQSTVINKYYIGLFYFYIGDSHRLTNNYDSAIRDYYVALKHNPYIIEGYIALAFCYEKKNNFKEASIYYKAIESVDPKFFKEKNINNLIEKLAEKESKSNPVSYHLNMALKYLYENKYLENIEENKKVLEIEPDNIEALHGLSSCLFLMENRKDNSEEIIKYSKKLQDLLRFGENEKYFQLYNSIFSTLYKAMSIAYEDQNNTEMAQQYEEANTCYKHFIEAQKAKIEERNKNKAYNNYKQAVDGFNLDKVPYNYYMIDEFIDFLFLINKPDEAKKYIEIAINQTKKDKNKTKLTSYKSLVGRYFLSIKENEKALKYLNQAFEEETNINAKYNTRHAMATTYVNLKDIDKALKAFDDCIKLVEEGAKDNLDALSEKIQVKVYFDKNSDFNKGILYQEEGIKLFEAGKYQEAIDSFSKSLHYLPLNIHTLTYLCQSLYVQKDLLNASKVAEEGFLVSTLEHNYDQYETFCSFLVMYYDDIEKDYEKSLNYALAGYRRIPSNQMLYAVGNNYILLKEYDKAFEVFKNYNHNDPNDLCLKSLAFCYAKKEQFDKAVELYEKAHQLNPNDEDIVKSLEYCKEKLAESN